MKKVITWIFCLLLLIFMPGITYAENIEEISSSGKYVFDYYYINWAWGYVLKGFYIDKDGNIFHYERKKDPWKPKIINEGRFSTLKKDELEDKYQNTQQIGKLDLELLKEKIKLIIPASKGEIIREHRAYDAGGKTGNALLYDSNREKYLIVNLGTIGIADFEKKNTSKEAESLLKWLQDVEREFEQSAMEKLQ